MMKITKTKSYKIVSKGVWAENPVSVQVLGICSALAVTVQMKTAVVMSVALTFVCAFSSLIISLMRHEIPRNIRIIAQLTVIASLVILADHKIRDSEREEFRRLCRVLGLEPEQVWGELA